MHSGTKVVSGSIDDVEMLKEDADIVDSLVNAVDSDTSWLPVGNKDVIVDAESCDAESSVDIVGVGVALSGALIVVELS